MEWQTCIESVKLGFLTWELRKSADAQDKGEGGLSSGMRPTSYDAPQ